MNSGMMQMHTPLKLTITGAVMTAFVMAAPSALAQDATTTATTTTTTAQRQVRTSATPEMIEEAIQRSLARSEKLQAQGKPEQFGSEEPFTLQPRR